MEEAAEQAQSHVDDVTEASETVQGEWSEVKDDFQKASAETWSAPEAPQPPVPPQPDADRWGTPEVNAPDDPSRWNSDLYTPGKDDPETPEAPKVVDYVAAAAAPAEPRKKEKFPVWAIVLIVLLVLCVCIACPIIIFGTTLLPFVRDSFSFLPALII